MEGILCDRMNFSPDWKSSKAIKIDRRKDINYYDTLCLYCSDNAIDLSSVSDEEFEGCSIILESFGSAGRNNTIFYFWID